MMPNNLIKPPFYAVENWYSLSEVSDVWDLAGELKDEIKPHISSSTTALASEIEDIGIKDEYPALFKDTTNVKDVVLQIFNAVQKRFYDHYCFCIKSYCVPSYEEVEAESKKFARKFFNVIEYTYERYAKLLELYQSSANELMKQLEESSQSNSRFNDTPQAFEVNLAYDADQFTSSLTKMNVTHLRDSDTPIRKLEEIHNNYRNLLLEWVNEFESIFVEESNI